MRLPVGFMRDGVWTPAGETRNISARGFLMVCDTELPVGERRVFTIDILADPPATVRVTCIGRILRRSVSPAPFEVAATIERPDIARVPAGCMPVALSL